MKNYNHLTQEERYSIGRMRQAGFKQKMIADVLGRSASTISRELKRNVENRMRNRRWEYRAERAHSRYLARSRARNGLSAMMRRVWPLVIRLLAEDLSPQQIGGYLRRIGPDRLSHERIYQLIYRDYKQGGKLWLKLRRGHAQRYPRKARAYRCNLSPERRRIEDRPAVVAAMERFGDWEADSLRGRAGSVGGIVTLVERKSKLLLARKVSRLHTLTVVRAIIAMLRPFRVHTITFDNGTEFHQYQRVERALH